MIRFSLDVGSSRKQTINNPTICLVGFEMKINDHKISFLRGGKPRGNLITKLDLVLI